MQRMVNSRFDTHRKTPFEIVLDDTPDISEYMDFSFYSYVTSKENAGLGDSILTKFLGVSHKIGNSMCYFVLKANGKVLSRSTVQPILKEELHTDQFLTKKKIFDDELNPILNHPNFIIANIYPLTKTNI